MAHYALLNENSIVTQVITGNDENSGGINWEKYYSRFFKQTCKRTSYNTSGNVHEFGGIPFRLNFAGIGYLYREDLDGFIPPQPFLSWTLNESTGLWEAPSQYPNDGNAYVWNEESLSWLPINSNS